MDAIEKRLLEKVDGVLAVHEFHVWQLAGDRIIASAHIRCRNLSEYMNIAEKVKEFFHNEGIHSTTIQPEFLEIEALHSTSGRCLMNHPMMINELFCPLLLRSLDINAFSYFSLFLFASHQTAFQRV